MKTNKAKTLNSIFHGSWSHREMILKGITAIAGLMWLSAVHLAAATFTVTNALDDGPGSLREAIMFANVVPSLDTIAFYIPGAGVHTIMPVSDLPQIARNRRTLCRLQIGDTADCKSALRACVVHPLAQAN